MKQNRLFTKGAFLALFLSLFSLTALFGQTLTITTTVCTSATEVRMTGPFWNWNPTGGPIAVSNGDGTWTFTFNPAPTADMEYLLIVDGVQENLIQAMVNGGTCAPVTNYSSYANRRWLITDPLTITNTYGQCGTCGGSTLTQMDLPVTFEGSTIEYGVIGFEGAQASTIEVDPTNANNTVVKVIKSAAAQPWAGTTITAAAELGLATPIPFTASNQTMTLKVWSPDAGITVRMKVEEHGNNTHTVETDAVTTVAGQWETLTFNFANQGAGTAAINLAYTYDKPTVFFNYGVNGATAGEKTYYFDDLMMGTGGGTGLAQMTLPVNFEGTTIDYGVIGFEGAQASTIEVDPTNANNMVVKVIKSATAQPWAGTTITAAAELGLASPIPFTASNQKMTLKVWSPDAGITVRLKVEEHGNNTHTVETDAVTTVAGQWETLTFDFANQGAGTAAINLAYTYDKPTVFFNYGVNGATAGEKTYYFDDLKMYALPASGLQITVDVCSIAATEVRMTGPFWSWDPTAGPFAVNNNDGTWTFTLDPIPTTDMEYLIIVNGVQESLISDMQNGGNCAPVTDFFGYANRKWVVGSGNVFISYDRCVPCSYPNIVITTEVCSTATSVRLTGPNWQWNPNFGPAAVSNGDGTYTFTISPAPNDTLEYLLVKDGVVENLIQEMVNGAGCAPLTDYSTYANRRWIIGQGAVSNTYGRCSPCSIGIGELTDSDLVIFPNPADSKITVSSEHKIEKIEIYSMLGALIATKKVEMNETEINLENFTPGVYTFNVYANDAVKVVRIIKN